MTPRNHDFAGSAVDRSPHDLMGGQRPLAEKTWECLGSITRGDLRVKSLSPR